MPFSIRNAGGGVVLALNGSVTIRDAHGLSVALMSDLPGGAAVTVDTRELDDIDTSILQLLCSVRKTSASFCLPGPSGPFIRAVDRCALRRELLAGSRENA